MSKPNVVPQGDQANKTVLDLLGELTSKGPVWLRAIGAITLLLVVGGPYASMLRDYLNTREVTNKNLQVNAPLPKADTYGTAGTHIAKPPDAPSPGTLSTEDALHLSNFHYTQHEESPAFMPLLVNGVQAGIDYTFFPSDGCILINHHKPDGRIKSDLVRADAGPPQVAQSRNGPAHAGDGDEALMGPRALEAAAQLGLVLPPTPLDATPVQAGCINPHPGQFQYWTVDVNSCTVQYFRKFPTDGCTHYQFYDRCKNQWDPMIHWTYCNPQHKW